MTELVISGVRVAVHRVHDRCGYLGRPYVAQVADALLTDGNGRPKRYATIDQAVRAAHPAVRSLLAYRRELERAWFG